MAQEIQNELKSNSWGGSFMKLKKPLLSMLLSACAVGVVGCGNTDTSSSSDTRFIYGETLHAARFTDEGKTRLSGEPTDQSLVDQFISLIISKGGEAITGGISVYAKTIALNLLKECGLDLRDATTKTLERMQTQLNIIEQKVDAIAAKQEQYHSEDILTKVLDLFQDANWKYVNYVTGSLSYLADVECDETISEEDAEKERRRVYNDGVKDLIIDASPFATYVTTLARRALEPNSADKMKDIFYYYDHTIGLCDKWTIQYYKNVKNFIAYLDSALILLSDLAKFQIYYKAQEVGEGMRRTYELMMNDMAAAVNQVNALFAAKLKEIDYIRYDWERTGMNKYIATNKYYSTRVATLTYDLDDKGYGDSRQGLVLAYKNDAGKQGNLQVTYTYQPNLDIVQAVANDFRSFSGDYCTSSYTIKDYLASAGFWCKNQDIYDKAAGLFAGNMYVDKYGFMHDDKDYSIAYYDNYGNFKRTNAFSVATYHTWYGGVSRTELRSNDKNYYICFGVKNGYDVQLDGSYQSTYMYDCMHTVANAVYFHYPYMDLYQKTGPITFHDRW